MDGMPDIFLLIICGFLWAILTALKSCVTELGKINQRLEVKNGLESSSIDTARFLQAEIVEQNRKLSIIEEVSLYFYGVARKSRGE